MGEVVEILITSDANGSQWSSCAWNPRTGSSLVIYKGGGAAHHHATSLIKNSFLVTANSIKPLIHIWPMNSQDQVPGLRLVVPGRVNALAVSPDGNFLIAGIQDTIYVWQICSGKMLNMLTKHYQTVTTIKFTDDGSHFLTSGQDGCVIAWNLTRICQERVLYQEPHYIINDHALSVTDIYIGNGGLRGHLCSVSVDRTCKLYDLSCGKILLNVVFDSALTCVTMNGIESRVYVGTSTGLINSFHIKAPPRTREFHMTGIDSKCQFDGHHKGPVSTLSLSLDGKTLCSGGHDGNVFLWDINSKQLLRTLTHPGAITNAFFTMSSKNIVNPEVTLTLIAENFKRMLERNNNDDDIVEVFISSEQTEEEEVEMKTLVVPIVPIIPAPTQQAPPSAISAASAAPAKGVSAAPAKGALPALAKRASATTSAEGASASARAERVSATASTSTLSEEETNRKCELIRLTLENRKLRKLNKELFLYTVGKILQPK